MRKWLPVFAIFFTVLTSVWFWSLGALPAEERMTLHLTEASGDVQVARAGSEAFVPAGAGDELSTGDRVKTGPASSALIDFYGSGQTHLDEKTEVELLETPESSEALSIRIRLEAGRIWSRALNLLAQEGMFEAETSDVVATVRGTSFSVEKRQNEQTRILVADSIVEASSGGEEMFLPEGFAGEFRAGKSVTSSYAIPETEREQGWFRQNADADEAFKEAAADRITASLALERVPRTGLLKDVVRASELLRQRFGSEERKAMLRLRYALRRLALIRRESTEGNAGAAFREYSRFENELRLRMAENGENAVQIRKTLIRGYALLQSVLPEDGSYRLKQQMEDFILQTSSGPKQEYTARLLATNARLDESAILLKKGDKDGARSTAQVAKTALGNITRELTAQKALENELRKTLLSIALGYRIRTEALLKRIEAMENVPEATDPFESATSTEPIVSPTSTEPIPGTCVGVRVQASPNPVAVGDAASVRVYQVRENGGQTDVTSASSFTMTGSAGALQGNAFIAAQVGTARVTASTDCGGERRTQSVDIVVYEPVVPEALFISPERVTIGFFQQVGFDVRVRYSNGETKVVTAQSSFSQSDERLGTLEGSVFRAGQLQGVQQITAAYAEGGKTLSASATLIIQDASVNQ